MCDICPTILQGSTLSTGRNGKCEYTVADPDLELRKGGGGGGGGGLDLLALLAFFPSAISSFFIQNKGARARAPRVLPLDPPLINDKWIGIFSEYFHLRTLLHYLWLVLFHWIDVF